MRQPWLTPILWVKLILLFLQQKHLKWGSHALCNILSIIHGRCRDVPRQISLFHFVDIAVIADYYQCAGALELAAELWRNSMEGPPEKYGVKSIMWLYIAKVFSWSNLYSQMAKLTLEHGQGIQRPFETWDLPVGAILERIGHKRQVLTGRVLGKLDSLAEDYDNNVIGCDPKCRALMKRLLNYERGKLKGNHLMESLSIATLIDGVNNFNTINCRTDSRLVCNAKGHMQETIESIQEELKEPFTLDSQA
ncbi:hypothetical protein IL306_001921 [Fusarium sp. DS 682]|nr:hypothetical protein IL306_001921 [Fusarium sp. DS 682]